jgi:hypothetical protein
MIYPAFASTSGGAPRFDPHGLRRHLRFTPYVASEALRSVRASSIVRATALPPHLSIKLFPPHPSCLHLYVSRPSLGLIAYPPKLR